MFSVPDYQLKGSEVQCKRDQYPLKCGLIEPAREIMGTDPFV